jgi:hypothetical protein
MSARSPKSSPATCMDTSSTIFLPGLAAGLSRLTRPVGPAKNPSGPEAVPARPSAARERKSRVRNARAACLSRALDELATSYAQTAATLGLPTSATYGRSSGDSSPSADLQSALASKLRARTDLSGSPEFELVWKSADMVLGPPIILLRASPRRIAVSASSGQPNAWPTPRAIDFTDQRGKTGDRSQEDIARAGLTLPEAARFAPWSTPSTRDWKDTPGMSQTGVNPDGSERTRLDQLPRQAALAPWPTPNSGPQNDNDSTWQQRRENAAKRHGNNGFGLTLGQAVTLSAQAGQDLARSSAVTEKPAASRPNLNPFFSGWLMSFPVHWAISGIKACVKLQKQRKASRSAASETPSA